MPRSFLNMTIYWYLIGL